MMARTQSLSCKHSTHQVPSQEADEGQQHLNAVVGRVLLRHIQLEPQATTSLLNHAAAHIAGHDDQRVLEVNCATLRKSSSCLWTLLHMGHPVLGT